MHDFLQYATLTAMSWAFISDVHIKFPGDANEQILLDFLNKANQLKVEKIFLLGDIFDLMIGEKMEYLKHYNKLFHSLSVSQAKEIHFIEGNHDFHLRAVWENVKKYYPTTPPILYHEKGLVLEKGTKRIWVSHGDDIELGNISYKLFRFFIRSPLAKFIANRKAISCEKIQKIADKIKKLQGEKKYNWDRVEQSKEGFRQAAIKIARKTNASIVVVGHSHVKDLVNLPNCTYINNGYIPHSKCACIIDDSGTVKHLELSSA